MAHKVFYSVTTGSTLILQRANRSNIYLVYFQSKIENENIWRVNAQLAQWHLLEGHTLLVTMEMQQTRDVLVRLDMLKASVSSVEWSHCHMSYEWLAGLTLHLAAPGSWNIAWIEQTHDPVPHDAELACRRAVCGSVNDECCLWVRVSMTHTGSSSMR